MPTTANFSLEYPDDNSSVDIAGHFETLADDVDAAINTRLALTGGTLTGALVGTLTTDSSSSTTGAFKTAGGMGIAKALYVGTTLNVTGATTLTGDLTISKASATHTISSSSGTTNVNLDSVAGTYKYLNFRTGTSARWTLGTTATAESGSNAGTDLFIGRSSDGGAYIDAPLTITRSTGAVTLTGNLTISKASPFLTVYATSGNSYVLVNRPAGSVGGVALQTNNATRWLTSVTNTVESGSNAGSDFAIAAYNDAGALLSTPLTITRSTGAVTLTGDVTISKASPALTMTASSGSATLIMQKAAGSNGYIYINNNNGLGRWVFGATNTAESGSNAGTNFAINAYDDAGSVLSTPLSITRSTGATTLTGDLTISKATATFNITSTSGDAYSRISRLAGNGGYYEVHTGGVRRWVMGANTSAESGSNLGSNFAIYAYDDAGSLLSTPLSISRYNGATTLSGDLTISKASPVIDLSATGATSPTIKITSNAGNNRNLAFYSGASPRWYVRADNTTESGSDAGSNFRIAQTLDSGASPAYYAFEINRATGKTTLGSVGSTAGLELGTSGPRMMSGTGSPEGVVTAPVGSIWYQTDSTVGVTHWRKATGAGNTGWVVMSGDTGWRDVSASLNATFLTANPNAKMRIRRTNDTVQVAYQAGTSATFTTNYATVYDPPTGFRTRSDTGFGVPYMALMDPTSATGTTKTLYVSGNSLLSGGTWVSATNYWGNMTYTTTETWPTSLPGSAA